LYSVDDDAQLRAKVEEAMAVYDEYVKTNQGEGEGPKEQKAEETA
jgi:polyadenylate-binding protein